MRPVLERAREYVLLSVRGLASKLQIDPSTLARMVRDCSFASYREFQEYLHELSIMQATPFDLMRRLASAESGDAGFVTESIKQEVANLQALQQLTDVNRVKALGQRFWEARRILVMAGDQAAVLGKYLGYHLSVLGVAATLAVTPGEVIHLARSTSRHDLVIAITFRRGLRQTVEGAQLARRNGAYCIGIADSYLSPLSRCAHELFLASVQTTGFGVSYVAPIALIDVIMTACAKCGGARAIAFLKEGAEEQRSGFRWFRESGIRKES
jgi:DNA-binding MurR/RpiR family transcriptional regulator